MHFRYTETAVAFEDALPGSKVPLLVLLSSCRLFSRSGAIRSSRTEGPSPILSSLLQPAPFHASNISNFDRFFFLPRFTSHYLATRTIFLERTGCSMSLSSSTCSSLVFSIGQESSRSIERERVD